MGLVCGQVCPAPELVKCVGLGLLGVLRVAGQNGPADRPHGTAVLPQGMSNSRFVIRAAPFIKIIRQNRAGCFKICETLKSML